MTKVSVIVPVYNTAEYVGRCIDSILAQTLQDIELIMVDDGSTDGSAQILDSYAAADPRVKVVHKPNGGVSSARNVALQMAQGEYIGFVDSDDYIAPQTYALAYEAAVEQGVELVQFNFCNVIDGEISPVVKRHNQEGIYIMPQDLKRFNRSWSSVCMKLIKRDLIFNNELSFFTGSYQGEDLAFSILMLSYLDRFYCLEDVLYFRVSRNDSALHTMDSKGYHNRAATYARLAEELQSRDRNSEYIKMAHSEVRKNKFKALLRTLNIKWKRK